MRWITLFILSCLCAPSLYAADTLKASLDESVDPCVDFFQYACGTWIKQHPLPDDRARFGTFDALQERNLTLLRKVLEKSAQNDPKRSQTDQKIGDYYAACIDEAAIDARGLAPAQELLASIDSLNSKAELESILAALMSQGVGVFFSFRSEQDANDATRQIAAVDQGGMGLPSRDYYFETDAKSEIIRKKYVSYIANLLALSGVSKAQASAKAKRVFGFEKALADKALRPVERRNPRAVYHLKSLTDLQTMAGFIDWTAFLSELKAPSVKDLNVAVIPFIENVNSLILKTNLEDLKVYMRARVLSTQANILAKSFEEANFDFYGRTLNGQKEMRPRWWRCATKVDENLGEALGQSFVKIAFAGDSKDRTLKLIANIENAFQKVITEGLPWMSAETKKQALVKLSTIAKKIGYPHKWRDYSALQIARGDFYGNSVRGAQFEIARKLNKIGKPIDKNEWAMTPPTVNAYYSAKMNNINFPAGILQPPFFDRAWDDARNYGGIGMVIGHEIIHGFDDQGRQFDANGNLKDWWAKEDDVAFKERAQCLIDEYAGFIAVRDEKSGNVMLNGQLTLGENAADNGGMRIAWNALMDYTNAKKEAPIEGFSAAQRFFIGNAQVWCSLQTPEAARVQAKTGPHSLGIYRVNGVVSNMPEFQEAFSCKTGQPMAPEKRCRIW